MSDKLNATSLYSSLTPAQKDRLFGAYKDYIALTRNFEQVVKRYKKVNLAAYELTRIFGKDAKENPWQIEYKTQTARNCYDEFLANNPPDRSKHYCYVSLNCTAKQFRGLGQGIIAAPEDFIIQSGGSSLPCRVERYVAAFDKNETLQNVIFNVSGNYQLTYCHKLENITLLKDAFADEQFKKSFAVMLDIISIMPQKETTLEKQDILNMQHEALASMLTQPFENIILSTLSSLAEETDNTLKMLISPRNKDYLYQAQTKGLIKSAALMQDTLNIRHLMRHQWDTLDGLCKFNDEESAKNLSIRQRYLDSYRRLCDKPLRERIDEYIKTADNFIPLISELIPEFIIRRSGQTNSKLIRQIKEVQNKYPRLYIQADYEYGEEKKAALSKNLAKICPHAELIDNTAMDMETFLKRIRSYLYRRQYVEIFSHLEYKICQYSLFSGQNLTPPLAWDYLRHKKILSAKENTRWNDFRKLRNDLSHKYLDEKLNARVQEMLPEFIQAAIALEDKLDTIMPKVILIQDNIYQARHPNGLIVTIDYAKQKVLNIITPDGRKITKDNALKKTPSKSYTEEYADNAAITVEGRQITSLRLTNGLTIDLKRRQLTYPDGVKLYFSQNGKYFLTAPDNSKIALSSELEVLNYIQNAKSITLGKNEELAVSSGHRLTIGKDCCLTKEKWLDSNKIRQQTAYSSHKAAIILTFSGGLKLEISPNAVELSVNAVKLSYENRKTFIEAASKPTSSAFLKKQKEGR
ncbi:MAG: hypothetical protein J6C85_05150 [Alphaproteobacteria bacterium]|nr:hypothetical protein [Alphaproteobacteria bacterium]